MADVTKYKPKTKTGWIGQSEPAYCPGLDTGADRKTEGVQCRRCLPAEGRQPHCPPSVAGIHGKDDRRITEIQVRRLFAAAEEPKALWLVDGASHSGIRTPVLDELAPDVIAFFDAALRDQA